MVRQHRNVYISLKNREIGFRGRIHARRNTLPYFAEEIAATSSTDNKACNLPGTPRCTFLVSFSPDHKLVASSHVDHCINISRLSTGEHIQTLTGHPRSPWCVTFHPSSNEILASGCLGGEVRVWDLQGSSEVWQSDNHSMIASLSFHPRDQVLAIATNDQILLWDWRQPVPFASVMISSSQEKVRLVRFSPLGQNLLTGIANAPVDEEPEPENLQQIDSRESRHRLYGVSDNTTPYPRTMRLDPCLSRASSSGLPLSQGSSLPREPERPMSPIQSETLEEAREYAAAVTLTALGLRRVNRESSLSNSFSWFHRGTRNDRVPPQGMYYGEDEPYLMHQADGIARQATSSRSGIGSQIRDQGDGSEEARIHSDNVGRVHGEWSDLETSAENGQGHGESRTRASQEESGNFTSMYVNMDVTGGDEIRVARTSSNVPQEHSDEARQPLLPHVGRLQQLPPASNQESPELEASVSVSSDNDQGISALTSDSRPLDLASGSRHSTAPSTSSQHVLDSESQNGSTKDCHSPEAKRHCPNMTEQDQPAGPSNLIHPTIQSSGPAGSSSSTGNRLVRTSRQRLSFSDAEVSSGLQDVGPSSSCHRITSSDERTLNNVNQRSTRLSSEAVAVAQASRPSRSDSEPTRSGGSANQRGLVTTSTDSESDMQPALLSETLSCPQAAVVQQSGVVMREQPRAYTAHLGTIPLTAPPDSTSDTDASPQSRASSSLNSASNRTISSMLSTTHSVNSTPHSVNSTSHSVNSTSMTSTLNLVNSTSDSVSRSSHLAASTAQPASRASHPISSTSHSSGLNLPSPSSSSLRTLSHPVTSISTSYNIPPYDASTNQNRNPVSSELNPLDLSVARGSSEGCNVPRSNADSNSPRNLPRQKNNVEAPREVNAHVPPVNVEQLQSSETSEIANHQEEEGSDPQDEYRPRNLARRDARFSANMSEGDSQNPFRLRFQASQGMDLSMHNARPVTRPRYAPRAPTSQDIGSRGPAYMQEGREETLAEPISDSLSTVNPMNPVTQFDGYSRYRRYNLWRSHHGSNRQRLPQGDVELGPPESQGVAQPTGPPGVAYGARRVAPLHTRRHLHVALLNAPSRQLNETERMDMPARVPRRILRQSRQGPLRSQLGRNQFSAHHHQPRNSIFDETYHPPPPVVHAAINRTIASAFAGRGETAVANNIGSTTFRLQWWDFSEFELPDINDADHNVIVPHCKLYNDASCDISQDSRYLATFVPSPLGFPDDGVLAIYSLMPHNFGDVLHTKSFGPNAITVSISPLSGFVMVGLASRKLHLHMSSKQLIGMIYKLHKEGAGEESLLHVCDVDHTCSETERRHHVSVNTVKWIPQPGRGLVYGTNRGDLRICSPSSFTSPDDFSADQSYQLDSLSHDDYPRHDLVHRRRSYMYMYQELGLRGLGLHPPTSSSSSPSSAAPERRARGTQTPQRALFSTATQTDDQGSP
ncbi:activating molecule in BECN1-regulated autophagy protein 1-like [Asterias rubens]|uniref:activating molecule in BECN1-regulated autophagy protein 1-like n=1 Tax=Asterias rubens TaxID=7604 RepID=UPI001455B10C|nr:activating molecule in BECN1-regulated autophagy protein 1-like [Asterias rubens]